MTPNEHVDALIRLGALITVTRPKPVKAYGVKAAYQVYIGDVYVAVGIVKKLFIKDDVRLAYGLVSQCSCCVLPSVGYSWLWTNQLAHMLGHGYQLAQRFQNALVTASPRRPVDAKRTAR